MLILNRTADHGASRHLVVGRDGEVRIADRVRVGKHPRQVADGFLVLAARQGDEAARQLEQEALLRARLEARLIGLGALEEEADLHAQGLRDGAETAGGDAVDALLVLVGLLVGAADQPGQLLLGQARSIRRSRIRAPTYRSIS